MSAIEDLIAALSTAHDAVADAVAAIAGAHDRAGNAVDAAAGLGSNDDRAALDALRTEIEELIGQGQALADAVQERQQTAAAIAD